VCNWRDAAHPNSGGAEVYTHEVLQRWTTRGYDVTLFCAAVEGRPAMEEINGVRVIRGGSRLGVYRSARRHYARNVGRFDVIVDEVNTRPFGSPSWPGNVPVVALVHQLAADVWEQEFSRPIALIGRYLLEPWWLRPYRHIPIVTCSRSSKESLEAFGLGKVSVLPVGVTAASCRPEVSRASQPTMLFVGRLAANKRPQDAITAHRLLRQRRPDVKLWIVGSGPMEAALREMADENVEFFGRVEEHEKYELMAKAHVLVVTSTREGWGMVVDESAAMGTPSVGYDVPGLRDSIPAARGFLVRPDPAALADELDQRLPMLVAHPAHAGWAGGAGSWADVADAFATILEAQLDAATSVPVHGASPHSSIAIQPTTHTNQLAEVHP
jgi:glycosyltransferase involved in cell wall biosynthesis